MGEEQMIINIGAETLIFAGIVLILVGYWLYYRGRYNGKYEYQQTIKQYRELEETFERKK